MNLLIVGLPGAGKGTQSDVISNTYDIPHVSTGNIFKKAIEEKTPLGLEVEDIIASGQLVSDDLTARLVEERLAKKDAENGFLLDGFPRNTNQSKLLDEILKKLNKKLDAVVYIKVNEDNLLERLTGRRVCPKDGSTYHVVFNPPKQEGICDLCQTQLITRKDDTPEVISERLEIAKSQTLPVLKYYEEYDLIIEIDGDSIDIEKISRNIVQKLDNIYT